MPGDGRQRRRVLRAHLSGREDDGDADRPDRRPHEHGGEVKRHLLAIEAADPNENPLQSLERDEFQMRLARAISTLPEREKLVLSLYYDDEILKATVSKGTGGNAALAEFERRVASLRDGDPTVRWYPF